MEKEYLVYSDRTKQFVGVCMNLLLMASCAGFIFMERVPTEIKVFLGIMVILMLFMEIHLIMEMKKKKLLYRMDEQGITDYTNPENQVHIQWTEVGKIETVVNNTSLQIGILGMGIADDEKEMGEALKKNLKENGNIAFYSIVIDGFKFRKKVFREILHQCRYLALKNNSSVIVTESRDPFLRR